jgi:phosphoserine phosphatase
LLKNEAEHLLEHWIEHNQSHSKSFRERALQIKEISEAAARDIQEAAELMDKCTEMLQKAKKDL